MKIWRRSDGQIAVDFTDQGGPFLVFTATQWAALKRAALAGAPK